MTESSPTQRIRELCIEHEVSITVDTAAVPIAGGGYRRAATYRVSVVDQHDGEELERYVELDDKDQRRDDTFGYRKVEAAIKDAVASIEEKRELERRELERPAGGAPDLTAKVIAFRSWELDKDLRLTSTGHGNLRWLPGAQRATCKAQGDHPNARRARFGRKRPSTGHQAPDKDCSCGFYALHDWREAAAMAYQGGYIVGAVAAWGKIEVHGSGIRAEWIEIVALAVPEPALITDPELAGKAKQLASDYGVDLVGLTSIADVAEGLGYRPVPKRLRPRDPDFSKMPNTRAVGAMAQSFGLMGASGASIATARPRFSSGGVVGTGPIHGASAYPHSPHSNHFWPGTGP